MAKKKERSELEFLRGENRRLKSIIRSYQRKVKQYEKYEPEDDTPDEYTEPKFDCPQCGKGNIQEFDFHRVKIRKCVICGCRP